jgi:hypothetical protein
MKMVLVMNEVVKKRDDSIHSFIFRRFAFAKDVPDWKKSSDQHVLAEMAMNYNIINNINNYNNQNQSDSEKERNASNSEQTLNSTMDRQEWND